MLGAIFGDIVGSVYEFNNTHNYNFVLISKFSEPTDDTAMTLAVAKAMMESYGKTDEEIKETLIDKMKEVGKRYPHAGYGGRFYYWVLGNDRKPYNSYGNGSGMRVSSVGWMYDTLEETLYAAKLTAEVTHNHPEGIKGAKAIAAAIFLARTGHTKEEIKQYISDVFHYDLNRTLDEIRPGYYFQEICQKSVPEAIIAFLEGSSYEDVIRKAVTLGGDSDTIACMAGAIAEAYYRFPDEFMIQELNILDNYQKQICKEFAQFIKNRK